MALSSKLPVEHRVAIRNAVNSIPQGTHFTSEEIKTYVQHYNGLTITNYAIAQFIRRYADEGRIIRRVSPSRNNKKAVYVRWGKFT